MIAAFMEKSIKLAHSLLLFTVFTEDVSFSKIGREMSTSELVFRTRILDSDSVRKARQCLALSQEWKTFRFANIFKGYKAQKSCYILKVAVTIPGSFDTETSNEKEKSKSPGRSTVIDEWLLCAAMGLGQSREMALNPKFEKLSPVPLMGLAAHLFRNSKLAPPTDGHVFNNTSTAYSLGLPIHVNGHFELRLENGGREPYSRSVPLASPLDALRAEWNEGLFCASAPELYLDMMIRIRDRLLVTGRDREFLKHLYMFWPLRSKFKPPIDTLINDDMYVKLAEEKMFLCSHAEESQVRRRSSFRRRSKSDLSPYYKLSGAYLPASGLSDNVQTYVVKNFPLFDVPVEIAEDYSSGSLSHLVHSFTPAILRKYLHDHPTTTSSCNAELASELLEFCLLDLDSSSIEQEMNGLWIMPLASGKLGTITRKGRGHEFILATTRQLTLMGELLDYVVHPDAAEKFAVQFADPQIRKALGIVVFTPSIFARLVKHILPAEWRNENFVIWNPETGVGPTKEWMKAFWSEVSKNDSMSIELFDDWPLIPIRGNELASCSLASTMIVLK